MLAIYNNGNYSVSLDSSGQKIRTLLEGSEFKPDFPETIDLKITDWCNAGCAYCHEDSTIRGKHCEVEPLYELIRELPSGIELAIGGGDPLSHPHLSSILALAQDNGLICNITVNVVHLHKHAETLKSFQIHELIHGIGVSAIGGSIWNRAFPPDIWGLKNVVLHIINGLVEFNDFAWDRFYDSNYDNVMLPSSILILGYKNFRRGEKYAKNHKIQRQLEQNRHCFGNWLYRALAKNTRVSFDNLALEQLEVKDLISADAWNRFYMGDDGNFSMFIDAVTQESAVTSTSTERVSWNDQHPLEFFEANQIARGA